MKIVCTIYYILTIMNNGLRYLINEIYLWSFSFWVMSDMYVRGLIWLLWFMVILSIMCWYGFRVWHPSSLVSTLRLKFFFPSNAHVSFIYVISLLLVDILYLLSCFRIILYLIQTTTGSKFVQNVVAIH